LLGAVIRDGIHKILKVFSSFYFECLCVEEVGTCPENLKEQFYIQIKKNYFPKMKKILEELL
jgi:hypothetical protein